MSRPSEGWKLRAPRTAYASYTVRFRHDGEDFELSTSETTKDRAAEVARHIYEQTTARRPARAIESRRALDVARGASSEGFVYFIQAGEAGPIKIGWTKSVPARFSALQAGNAEPLRLLAVLPGRISYERALHSRFAGLLIRGEWFRPDKGLLAFIREASL